MNFKLSKTLVIWIIIVLSVLALGVEAAMYFRVAKVPVLNKDVPAGKKITKDMITLVDINPNSPLLKNSVKNINELFIDGNPQGTTGKYTLVAMFKGQLVDKRGITNSLNDPSYGVGAAIEDDNHVAISIQLPIQNAVGVNMKPGEKVNLTYALGQPSSTIGEGTIIDKDTLKEIKGVQILDIKNENGVKILDGNVPTGKKVLLVISIPNEEFPTLSLAASGQGIIYLSLPTMSAQEKMSNNSSVPSTQNMNTKNQNSAQTTVTL